jgi:hypothetical protein
MIPEKELRHAARHCDEPQLPELNNKRLVESLVEHARLKSKNSSSVSHTVEPLSHTGASHPGDAAVRQRRDLLCQKPLGKKA